jgi:hypothetical protein
VGRLRTVRRNVTENKIDAFNYIKLILIVRKKTPKIFVENKKGRENVFFNFTL